MKIHTLKYMLSILVLLIAGHFTNAQTSYAPYGGAFTPAGDIRMLVVFAGFDHQCTSSDPDGLYSNSEWPVGSSCDALPVWANDLFYNTFSSFSASATDKSLSNFYYQASRLTPTGKPLRIIADVYPKRVNISVNSYNERLVFDKIKLTDPTFDWSKYDNRGNNPNYQNDYSNWGAPDNVVDYVIVVWRKPGLGGQAGITTYNNIVPGLNIRQGFRLTNAVGYGLGNIVNLFKHELAHTLYNCPHFFEANGAKGSTLYGSNGWGMMTSIYLNNSANAWEKWYLRWLDIPSGKHITSASQNGIYTLSDFNTTGDFMVINLPFTNQRLWLENHVKTNTFEERNYFEHEPCGSPIAPSPQGVMMFVEQLTDDREHILSALSTNYTNRTKSIHALGNHDYTVSGPLQTSCVYSSNNYYYNMTLSPNPLGQHNDVSPVRGNFAHESNANEIYYRSYTNGSNGLPKCEETPVWMKDGNRNLKYFLGSEMAFGNQFPKKVGISYNPAITNVQTYNQYTETLSPVFLNGISIRFISKASNGTVTFEVKYNDTDIEKNQRFSGNLVLNDIPNAAVDLNVTAGNTLTINKSGTPDRITKLNGSFVNPTILSVKSGAKIETEPTLHIPYEMLTRVYVKDDSEVFFEDGSSLLVGNKGVFTMEDNSYMEFAENAQLTIQNSSFIVDSGAELCIRNSDNLTLTGGALLQYHGEKWYGTKRIGDQTITSGTYGFFESGELENIVFNTTSTVKVLTENSLEFKGTIEITPSATGDFYAVIGSIETSCRPISSPRIIAYEEAYFEEDHDSHDHSTDHCFILPDEPEENYIFDKLTEEEGLESDLRVSPVPANEFVMIESLDNSNISQIYLYNALGVLINSYQPTEAAFKLDVSMLGSGVYIIKVKTTEKTYSRRIIVSK